MVYVYSLHAVYNARQHYVGLTDDPERRINEHNQGKVPSTKRYRPWKMVAVIGVATREKAVALEKYMKSGAGRSFAKRRLW